MVDMLYATQFLEAKNRAGKEVKELVLKGSEQELLDHHGDGSNFKDAFLYVHNRFLATGEDLPFLGYCATTGVDEQTKHARLQHIERVKKLGPRIYAGSLHKINRSRVREALESGPVMASVYASPAMMRWDDTDKVYVPYDYEKMKPTDHGVLLVGYGVYEREKIFYIAKSSWGKNWAHEGFMKIDEKACFDFSTVKRCKLLYNDKDGRAAIGA